LPSEANELSKLPAGQRRWGRFRKQVEERARIGRSARRIRVQQGLDCGDERGGRLWRHRFEALVLAATRAIERLDVVVAVERPAPSKAFVKQHPQGEEIRSRVAPSSECVLRGHVGDITSEPKNIL
jgi:hypothetical protein